jgi:TatD DNase family protein
LGFHPQLAAARKRELALFEELAPSARYVGEVGLDFSAADEADRKAQLDVFRTVLATCAAGGKVLSVHTRRATAETIDSIGDGFRSTVILHWYSGALHLIERAASYGFFFSVNAAMTESASGQRIIKALPRDRVLLESDGPFVQVDNRPATPLDGERVIRAVAHLWQMTANDVAATIARSLRAALARGTKDEDPITS